MAHFAERLGLLRQVQVKHCLMSAHMKADVFEAVLAAVCLDRGMRKAERLVLGCLRRYTRLDQLVQADVDWTRVTPERWLLS